MTNDLHTHDARVLLMRLHSRTFLGEATELVVKELRDAADAGAEKERLRFEGDLDKWMKKLGAGITGYQPEAYAVMDAACDELVRLRKARQKWLNETCHCKRKTCTYDEDFGCGLPCGEVSL